MGHVIKLVTSYALKQNGMFCYRKEINEWLVQCGLKHFIPSILHQFAHI